MPPPICVIPTLFSGRQYACPASRVTAPGWAGNIGLDKPAKISIDAPMIMSHVHKFIFIKTKKTAGSSIELTLSKICGEGDTVTPLLWHEEQKHRTGMGPRNYLREGGPARKTRRDGIPKADREFDFFNHMPASKIKSYVGDEIWSQYLRIAFVRNPWDRAVSTFFWRGRKGDASDDNSPEAFREFLKTSNMGNNLIWNKISIDDQLAINFVGRYERMAEDLDTLSTILNLAEPLRAESLKTGSRPQGSRSYRDYYDDESREFIRRLFAREIEEFAYEF
jgi:hypothetical protein